MESLLGQSLQHSLFLGLAQQEVDLMVTFGFVRLTTTSPLKKSKMLLLPGDLLYAHFQLSHYPMRRVLIER